MKIKLKSGFDFELEVQRNSKKKKKKSDSTLKKLTIWLIGAIASSLVGELVTWIIKSLMNRSFYFINRIFYFEEDFYV